MVLFLSFNVLLNPSGEMLVRGGEDEYKHHQLRCRTLGTMDRMFGVRKGEEAISTHHLLVWLVFSMLVMSGAGFTKNLKSKFQS